MAPKNPRRKKLAVPISRNRRLKFGRALEFFCALCALRKFFPDLRLLFFLAGRRRRRRRIRRLARLRRRGVAAHAFLEFADSLSETLHYFGDFAPAKEHQ